MALTEQPSSSPHIKLTLRPAELRILSVSVSESKYYFSDDNSPLTIIGNDSVAIIRRDTFSSQ